MFGLPEPCIIHKVLAKAELLKFLNLSNEKRTLLENEIKRLTFIAEISPASLHIQTGQEKKMLFVLQVELKNQDIVPECLISLAKGIKQNLLFVLTNTQDQAKLAIFEQELFQTAWQTIEEINVPLEGIDIDQVWQNLVLSIGGFNLEKQNTLAQQITLNAQKITLSKKINLLENKRNKEVQSKKKLALHKEIQLLQAELQNL